MSVAETKSVVPNASAGLYAAGPEAYFALLKPRVMSLSVMTALSGLLAARAPMHPALAAISILAIAAGAGAAGALNMWFDADIDARMARTRARPVPMGLIAPGEALAFGLTLAFFAVLTLSLAANELAGALLAFTIFFYVVVYTMWLKRRTPQNIVIGGAAGALPPVIGYAAASGSATLDSFILFAIVFFWTPPHFWALALVKMRDYERAGVPMLPNVKGAKRTRAEIFLYTLALAPLGLAPVLTGLGGPLYLCVAFIGGLFMIVFAWRLLIVGDGEGANRAAMALFGASILYLFALFFALIVERAFAFLAPLLR